MRVLGPHSAIAAVVVVAVSGCGGGGHAVQGGAAGDSFLGRLSGGLIYVEWSGPRSQLAGTLDQVVVQPQRRGPAVVRVDHAMLTGAVVGGRLILSINGAATIAGRFRGKGVST